MTHPRAVELAPPGVVVTWRVGKLPVLLGDQPALDEDGDPVFDYRRVWVFRTDSVRVEVEEVEGETDGALEERVVRALTAFVLP